jgi:hypothetical protein
MSESSSQLFLPESVWPRKWIGNYLVDLRLKDGRIVERVLVASHSREIVGQCSPPLGEPGPIKDTFNPDDVVAIKPYGGWRDFVGLKQLFPHRWQYCKR